jgi:hypothetical protein
MLAVSQESECVLHARATSRRRNYREGGEGAGCGPNGVEESEGRHRCAESLAEHRQCRAEKAQASEQRREMQSEPL